MPRFPFDIESDEPLWLFTTKNLCVQFFATPCEDDPSSHFEDEEDVENVRNGVVEWFDAWVIVSTHEGDVLGYNHLGGCAYATFDEFITSHRDPNPANRNTLANRAAHGIRCHYFPSMVAEACAEARGRLLALQQIRVTEPV